MTDLYEALQPVLDDLEESDAEEEPVGEERQRAVQLAIMGLPNVVSSCAAAGQAQPCLQHDALLLELVELAKAP